MISSLGTRIDKMCESNDAEGGQWQLTVVTIPP